MKLVVEKLKAANKVSITVCVLVLFLILIWSNKADKYERKISLLEQEVEQKDNQIKRMESSIEMLSSDAKRLEYEDWSDVVPDLYRRIKLMENGLFDE